MITCNEYDYIEIVCLYHYPIKISLKSGGLITCIALDTKRNENREECMEVDCQGVKKLVLLDDISELKVTIDNSHFNVISFS
jgi:Rho-binding antiterminator